MTFDHPAHWKCESCGLPGVRLMSDSNQAYYKCVPCNRSLGVCPCVTPGARTTGTCPCGEESDADMSDSEGIPLSKQMSNGHNPDAGFDVDWESNCKPGFMVSRFKATGEEILPFAWFWECFCCCLFKRILIPISIYASSVMHTRFSCLLEWKVTISITIIWTIWSMTINFDFNSEFVISCCRVNRFTY